MFFSKKSNTPWDDENVAKKSIRHMDAVVTGVILGGIVGSIYGVKKLKEKHVHDEKEHTHLIEPQKVITKKGFFARLFGR
jgi:hypothetical protein